MKKLSIGTRLALWYFAIFAVAQIIFGAGMWFSLSYHLYDLAEDSLENQLEDLKHFLEAQKKDASLAKIQEEVNETYLLEHSGDYLELYAENDQLIYRSSFLQSHSVTMPLGGFGKPVFRNIWLTGRPFRFTVQRLSVNGHLYRAITGIPMDDEVETLHLFRTYLFMFAPLLFLVAAAGGYWLSLRALAPVDALVRTAHDISGFNLDRRLPKLSTGDELQRLSDTLNEMLDRIEKAFLRVTQFTADASHELRTPISLIRTEAELALRRSRGEAEYKESLRAILLEAERTTAIVEELLALARADSGRETLQMRTLDFSKILGDVQESWRQVAEIRNLQFSTNIAPDILVVGDATVLRKLIDLLLDNALKYTPSPGCVELSLERMATNAVLKVHDSGPGIAKEEQSKIFERFYRVDKARTRAEGGVGLGLAIAKWIVTQHQGTIAVESESGAGSTFFVELPLAISPLDYSLRGESGKISARNT
jgi:two-component system, OmpR family, heavy metal sensor histidine kinase CusS